MSYRLHGTVLPGGEQSTVYVRGGRFTHERPAEPVTTLAEHAWLAPGLVDCHAHLSLASPAGDDAAPGARVRASAAAQRDSGVLLIREPGSPDRAAAALHDRVEDLPPVVTGGRFLAAPGRYFPGLAREVDPAGLPAAVTEEASGAAGWIKVIGDFFSPRGRVEPSWTEADLRAAAEAAHAAGARAAIHATHPETIAAAAEAGFDSVEHGTGMTRDLLDLLAARRVTWVPTLVISDGVREIAGNLHPDGAREIRGWLDALPAAVAAATAAGVTVLAGTDAGMVPHGLVPAEVAALVAAGVPADAALGAASWHARRYLGAPLIEEGAPADLVAYAADPRADPAELTRPVLILLGGRVIRGGA